MKHEQWPCLWQTSLVNGRPENTDALWPTTDQSPNWKLLINWSRYLNLSLRILACKSHHHIYMYIIIVTSNHKRIDPWTSSTSNWRINATNAGGQKPPAHPHCNYLICSFSTATKIKHVLQKKLSHLIRSQSLKAATTTTALIHPQFKHSSQSPNCHQEKTKKNQNLLPINEFFTKLFANIPLYRFHVHRFGMVR